MLQLIEPTLLLDKNKCLKNIEQMAAKAQKNNVALRPHFKTHQSREIGRWFRPFGVEKITVSSLRMAEYFSEDDWKDITVAFPVNVHEIERINSLAERITLNLLIVAPETIEKLANELKFPVNVFVEVDSGDHRTGVNADDFELIDKIISEINRFKKINFKGFLTHAGHSYGVKSDTAAIAEIYQKSVDSVLPLKIKYAEKFPDLIVSYGDTPTCSLMENFDGVDEIRAGNFVFYDVVQCEIGSCAVEQIAVAMACPVVAKYPERNEIVIYGGAVHFSKDALLLPGGKRSFGKVVRLEDKGWDTAETGAFVNSLSQEHGVIYAPFEMIEQIKIGDFVGVLPVHSCLTADVMKNYVTLDGEKIEKFNGI